MTYDERLALVQQREIPITVNGNRGCIGGASNDYALVTDLTIGMHCEFAWQTVKHIIDNKNGAFSTI